MDLMEDCKRSTAHQQDIVYKNKSELYKLRELNSSIFKQNGIRRFQTHFLERDFFLKKEVEGTLEALLLLIARGERRACLSLVAP